MSKKLKEAYDIKKELVTKNAIPELGSILEQDPDLSTTINPDNTLRIESNSGLDSIKDNLENGIVQWLNRKINIPVEMICNTLPINNNGYIIHI